MNKLVIDKEKMELKDIEGIIEIKENNNYLTFKGNNKIWLETKENNLNLDIILEDNSVLDLSLFFKNRNINSNIVVKQNNNTKFYFKESLSSNELVKINIQNNIIGNNNLSNILLRCISYKESINIDCIADVKENSLDNEIIEDIKGLNQGGEILIKPEMEINTSEVMANHFVSIGKVSSEDLFYLESKGLSEKKAEELILDGFLQGIMEVIKDE